MMPAVMHKSVCVCVCVCVYACSLACVFERQRGEIMKKEIQQFVSKIAPEYAKKNKKKQHIRIRL